MVGFDRCGGESARGQDGGAADHVPVHLGRVYRTGQFQRARVALDAADGRADAAIARELGVHLSTVRRRRKRFHTAGPAALQDRKRPGHRPRYGPEVHWRSWTPQLSARVHAELGQLHLRVADVSRQPGQMDPVPQGAPERGPLVQRPRLFRCQAIAVASES